MDNRWQGSFRRASSACSIGFGFVVGNILLRVDRGSQERALHTSDAA
jgi:hypothetical protein